jgi:hypothetical protein
MNKSRGSLSDQLKALGLDTRAGSKSSEKERAKKPISDFRSRSAREPSVTDREAEMNRKLARAASQAKDARKANMQKMKPAESATAPQHKPAPPNKPAPDQTPGVPGTSEGAKAFERIISVVGAARPIIERRPRKIPSSEARRLDDLVRNGAEWLRKNPKPDLDNGFVVGFDFGTSSLKVVVRDPYVAGHPLAALPAPSDLRSQGHPYLWQTVVWFDPRDNTFRLYPTPGAITLEGFKTGIIAGKGLEPICDKPKISRSEGATAFVALHLCHLFGWYEREKPLARSKAKNFLSVNIGVPVATSDNPAVLEPFKEVVRAAAELACSCEPLTIERVRAALDMVKEEGLPDGFDLVPELSANLVGYANWPTSPWGAHVLIDVGASTLDIVAFNLVQDNGQAQIKAFSASVELLGAAAWDIACGQGISKEEFTDACNHQFSETYLYACREDVARSSFSPLFRREKEVQLVITGGGCTRPLHSDFINALRSEKRVLGPGKIVRPEPPPEITKIDCDRSRLLLAFGLAHDIPEIPAPTLPSRIPKITPIADKEPQYIGKDQV